MGEMGVEDGGGGGGAGAAIVGPCVETKTVCQTVK